VLASYDIPHHVYCTVCNLFRLSSDGDPRNNKNYRCNPSILIRYRPQSSNADPSAGDSGDENIDFHKNILIDAGKTFRETVVRWFPHHNVRSIDAVLLTHGHADSIFGIDDLRSTQVPSRNGRALNVYQSLECKAVTQAVYSYLYPNLTKNVLTAEELAVIKSKTSSISSPIVTKKRFTADINWIDMFPYQPFTTCGLEITPIPVMHGDDMMCMGFIFGTTEKVCYISDISRMLPKTMDTIKQAGPIDLFIVDAIRPGKIDYVRTPYPTHICIEEALDLVREIKPKKTLFIGMSASIEHESTNESLAKYRESESMDVQLAHDGLSVDIQL
jgi:phosphoribosyl 1,2-cyclic phosphodiesterase